MRMPNEGENLIGKICVSSVGRPFIVTGQGSEHYGPETWVGLGLDGKGTAASTQPCIIAESGQEFHDKLVERFNGKMSFNS